MTRSARPLFDDYARRCIAGAPHCIVAWWLAASYLYYHTAETLLSDEYYDELCRDLKARWDTIEHPHKALIDRDMLEAGTGYYLREADYPSMVIYSAAHLLENGVPILPDDALAPVAKTPPALKPAPPAAITAQGELF